MGAFGMSNAGKEAEGWPREWGAWSAAQAKNWIPRSDYAAEAGKEASDWYKDYQLNRVNNGIGTITDAQGLGGMIMPGVNDYVSGRKAGIQSQLDAYGQLPSWQSTMQGVDEANGRNRELNTRDLNYIDANRTRALESLRDTFNSNVTDYSDRYNKLIGDTGSTYDAALKTAERLKPGGQFQEAQVGRSFAPQIAGIAASMRKMGIDPSSPQAFAAMQRGETARSRAMDDAAAASTGKYVDAHNKLLVEGNRERTGLSIDQGTGIRGETTTRGDKGIRVQNEALDRIARNTQEGMAINDQDAKNALMRKAIATQDWETIGKLKSQMSDAELQAIGLNREQFDVGMGYRTADLNEKNAGAAGVGQYGSGQLGYGLQTGNMSQGWGNEASSNYNTAYEREAANAGWATKALVGAAGAGLNMVAPGVGTALTSGYGSATGQQPGGTGGWQDMYKTFSGWITPKSAYGPAGAPPAGGGGGYG